MAELSGKVIRFGGFVLAHTAAIAAAGGPGELICPYIVIVKDGKRQAIDFASSSQAESLAQAKASLSQYRNEVELWSLGMEGMWAPPDSSEPKSDILCVEAWEPGLEEPIVLIHKFRPTSASAAFSLIGQTEIYVEGVRLKEDSAAYLRVFVSEGIAQHPKGERWSQWVAR